MKGLAYTHNLSHKANKALARTQIELTSQRGTLPYTTIVVRDTVDDTTISSAPLHQQAETMLAWNKRMRAKYSKYTKLSQYRT